MTDSIMQPAGRVIMVSGASRGIGAAIALRLLSDGYRLSLASRNPDAISKVIGNVEADQALVTSFDAQDLVSAERWVADTVSHFGRIDGLVNNAGILRNVGFEAGDEEDLDDLWSINVKAPFWLIRLCMPHLRKVGNGRVVNIASTDGKRYRQGGSVGYTMSKHALVALTHAARVEGWKDGVRATALCPGAVDTDLLAGIQGATPVEERLRPETLASIVSTILGLPNTASVAEMPINTRLESYI
jgi:NAD(P)-dependent dehydrogenase (short-subunit alcohol dehydrogenase family)